jgi:hypothetical protein
MTRPKVFRSKMEKKMTTKPVDELRKELAAVAERLWRTTKSEEEFVERFSEHVGNIPVADFMAIEPMKPGSSRQKLMSVMEEILEEALSKAIVGEHD